MHRRLRRKSAPRLLKKPSLETKPNKEGRKFPWKFFSIALTVIVSFFGIISGYEPAKRVFMSGEQKIEDDNFYHNDLKPPKIEEGKINESFLHSFNDTVTHTQHFFPGILLEHLSKKDPTIQFDMGKMSYGIPKAWLDTGFSILHFICNVCRDVDLKIGIRGKRLYVSTKFNTLVNDELLGEIRYNHWDISKSNQLGIKYDDERLQVQDKNGNLALAVKYVGGNEVSIEGYFTSLVDVMVLGKVGNGLGFQCVSKNSAAWKTEVSKLVNDGVEPIF